MQLAKFRQNLAMNSTLLVNTRMLRENYDVGPKNETNIAGHVRNAVLYYSLKKEIK